MCSLKGKSKWLVVVCIIGLSFTGCKDDDPAPSKRPLLVGKTWAVTKYEMDGVDVTDELESCEMDNTTVFFNDGSFKDDMGVELCEEGETDVDGTWVFKADETVLSMHPSGDMASDWNIDELSASKLRLSSYVDFLDAEVGVVMEPQ